MSTNDKELNTEQELHAIAVSMYATSIYPAPELNVLLSDLKKLIADDLQAMVKLRNSQTAEEMQELREERKATMKAIDDFCSKHPLVRKFHECAESLSERGRRRI